MPSCCLLRQKAETGFLIHFWAVAHLAVVARKLNRKFCGVEINEEYCLWAAKRLLQADIDKTIQGYADGVFWERNSFAEQKRANKAEE